MLCHLVLRNSSLMTPLLNILTINLVTQLVLFATVRYHAALPWSCSCSIPCPGPSFTLNTREGPPGRQRYWNRAGNAERHHQL